jgi:hypothetical protein
MIIVKQVRGKFGLSVIIFEIPEVLSKAYVEWASGLAYVSHATSWACESVYTATAELIVCTGVVLFSG